MLIKKPEMGIEDLAARLRGSGQPMYRFAASEPVEYAELQDVRESSLINGYIKLINWITNSKLYRFMSVLRKLPWMLNRLQEMEASREELSHFWDELRKTRTALSDLALGVSALSRDLDIHTNDSVDIDHIVSKLTTDTREQVKERLSKCIEYVKKPGMGTSEHPILNVGCGRGEWLELFREHGLEAIGLDDKRAIISWCIEQGFSVVNVDALEYMKHQRSDLFSAVAVFHSLEFIPFRKLIQLLDEAIRVTMPGGIILLNVFDPERIISAQSKTPWNPKQVNFLTQETTKCWLTSMGWCRVHVLNGKASPEPAAQDAKKTNESDCHSGPGSYIVVGQKTKQLYVRRV
jgi:SAM-dependent methyltransferase